ncbi:hypothetical protein IEQ34_017356 [Dendrobium chrysotoxum]|uniref:Uncharacterized protein n=1 Tax=Dendrobium chrysotoxum TaxID=161865 RepID=A0AAV7GBS6_DENCH|nr:hypothetical protein IEQ34_017356 [Dendrobium chrysotoxum]
MGLPSVSYFIAQTSPVLRDEELIISQFRIMWYHEMKCHKYDCHSPPDIDYSHLDIEHVILYRGWCLGFDKFILDFYKDQMKEILPDGKPREFFNAEDWRIIHKKIQVLCLLQEEAKGVQPSQSEILFRFESRHPQKHSPSQDQPVKFVAGKFPATSSSIPSKKLYSPIQTLPKLDFFYKLKRGQSTSSEK